MQLLICVCFLFVGFFKISPMYYLLLFLLLINKNIIIIVVIFINLNVINVIINLFPCIYSLK